jgi:hypothetical protein
VRSERVTARAWFSGTIAAPVRPIRAHTSRNHTSEKVEMFARISPFAAAILVMGLLATTPCAADEDAGRSGKRDPPIVPSITELKDVAPLPAAFDQSSATKPLELKTAAEAAKVFSKEELAKLTKEVDFDRQVVLVFAWRGSGQDRLTFAVAESFPEQVFYTYQRGRTRDLRPHVAVHALRKNVTWKAR